jgi:hypothetical protein
MTTKEFIKMLQEEDPEGNGHIRMNGGVPRFAIAKEGYWDGPYSYIDEEGNYVTTIEGYKVDVYSMDVSDFVEDIYRHNETTWEDIKSKFRFGFSGYAIKSQREERADGVLKKAKEAFDMMVDIYNKLEKNK